ncbi:MAG: hydrogenase maturation protease [Rhodoferax sp.]|nr:hydrogenase maturation protease [Rhodoferax sp.]MCF8208660.1 hydrogenase maturation protease [Rhodoferax sp.]
MKTSPPAATLVLGWGNLSRGDDALGPLFVDQLRARIPEHLKDQVEFLDDYQLQIEHAIDLVDRSRILFVDASIDCPPPFEIRPVQARRDTSYTSHALSAEALLQVLHDFDSSQSPSATLLAIRGESFGLGETMGADAQHNLAAALDWALKWLRLDDET